MSSETEIYDGNKRKSEILKKLDGKSEIIPLGDPLPSTHPSNTVTLKTWSYFFI